MTARLALLGILAALASFAAAYALAGGGSSPGDPSRGVKRLVLPAAAVPSGAAGSAKPLPALAPPPAEPVPPADGSGGAGSGGTPPAGGGGGTPAGGGGGGGVIQG